MAREGPEATRCPPHLVASGLAPLHATQARLALLDTMLEPGKEKQVPLLRQIIAGITSAIY